MSELDFNTDTGFRPAIDDDEVDNLEALEALLDNSHPLNRFC